ncbi:MAG: hypothetical protein BRD42_10170 [Bacteroidetes bacterium QS_3_64_15]|nr:MAG: hypothetical protein BRD42_10170 [Bacteroidetes bacterium QS_3_64_15]
MRPVALEWEDSGMDWEHGAEKACSLVRAYVPVRHEKVEVLNLKGCTDPDATNYEAYYVKPNPSSCRYE